MEKINNITLDSELLEAVKENLEEKINFALKYSIESEKTTRVNLKMVIEIDRNLDGEKIPRITYETGMSIKENGYKDKHCICKDISADLDGEGNILIKNNNEQQEIDENGNMIIEE